MQRILGLVTLLSILSTVSTPVSASGPAEVSTEMELGYALTILTEGVSSGRFKMDPVNFDTLSLLGYRIVKIKYEKFHDKCGARFTLSKDGEENDTFGGSRVVHLVADEHDATFNWHCE